MPKYLVKVYQTLEHRVEVEATDEVEASDMAFTIVYSEPDKILETLSLGTQEDDIEAEEMN